MVRCRVFSLFVAFVLMSLCHTVNAQGPIARFVNAVRPGVIIPKKTLSYSSGRAVVSPAVSVGNSIVSASDVGVGTPAWRQARREAELQAQRRMQGHIFGVAPGARMQGVGDSFSQYSPNHCTGIGLIARAGVQGRDGRWYWSAAYRR